MKKLLVTAILAMTLAGCATRYDVERTFADGSSIKAKAYSFRDMEQPKLSYDRKGDDEISFRYQAESIDNNTDVTANAMATMLAPFIGMATGIMEMVMKGQLVPAGQSQ